MAMSMKNHPTMKRIGADNVLVRDPIHDPPGCKPRWALVQNALGLYFLFDGEETRAIDTTAARRLIRELSLADHASTNLTIRVSPTLLGFVHSAAKSAGMSAGEFGRTAIARAVYGEDA